MSTRKFVLCLVFTVLDLAVIFVGLTCFVLLYCFSNEMTSALEEALFIIGFIGIGALIGTILSFVIVELIASS